MQLGQYVDRLREEFAVAAEAGGEDVRQVAERLVAPLDAAVRLVLLEALAAAAEEITLDLAPGSVHLRLRGRDADFVVTPAAAEPSPVARAGTSFRLDPDVDAGPVARVNFRPPEGLKTRIEEAAGREGISVNVWLVRAAAAALDDSSAAPPPSGTGRAGWFG